MNNSENTPRIFITDYASYNDGTQFEFGHWIDLEDYSDVDELGEYISKHFEEADKKSPLDDCGSTREEWMITDYENFPSSFYSESYCHKEMENLYTWLNLDEQEKIKVEFMTDQGASLEQAIEKVEDCHFIDDSNDAIYDAFDMYYPDTDELTRTCSFLTVDYDAFKRELYTEFTTSEGENLLFEDSWNH